MPKPSSGRVRIDRRLPGWRYGRLIIAGPPHSLVIAV